jgi:hypothetical protein
MYKGSTIKFTPLTKTLTGYGIYTQDFPIINEFVKPYNIHFKLEIDTSHFSGDQIQNLSGTIVNVKFGMK